PHALREAADAAFRGIREPDLLEHRDDARSRYSERGGEDREMTDRRPSGVPDVGIQEGADEPARLGQVTVARRAEERRARCGLPESEQRPGRAPPCRARAREET